MRYGRVVDGRCFGPSTVSLTVPKGPCYRGASQVRCALTTLRVRGWTSALLFGVVLFGAAPGPVAAQQPGAAVSGPSLSPKELLTASSGSMDRIKANMAQMQELLRKAQERGEADAIQCVRDKLAASRAMQDVASLARNNMQEALASNSQGRADAEYRKITVAETKVDQFLSEALTCLSDQSDSTNEVVRDSTGDTTQDNVPPITDLPIDPPDGTIFQ